MWNAIRKTKSPSTPLNPQYFLPLDKLRPPLWKHPMIYGIERVTIKSWSKKKKKEATLLYFFLKLFYFLRDNYGFLDLNFSFLVKLHSIRINGYLTCSSWISGTSSKSLAHWIFSRRVHTGSNPVDDLRFFIFLGASCSLLWVGSVGL